MKLKLFDKIVNQRCELIKSILIAKGKEYSEPDGDRLDHFKIAANLSTLSEIPEGALLGMWRKHIVSVIGMIDNIDDGSSIGKGYDKWMEKIGDSINYLILLEALLHERYNWELRKGEKE